MTYSFGKYLFNCDSTVFSKYVLHLCQSSIFNLMSHVVRLSLLAEIQTSLFILCQMRNVYEGFEAQAGNNCSVSY